MLNGKNKVAKWFQTDRTNITQHVSFANILANESVRLIHSVSMVFFFFFFFGKITAKRHNQKSNRTNWIGCECGIVQCECAFCANEARELAFWRKGSKWREHVYNRISKYGMVRLSMGQIVKRKKKAKQNWNQSGSAASFFCHHSRSNPEQNRSRRHTIDNTERINCWLFNSFANMQPEQAKARNRNAIRLMLPLPLSMGSSFCL